jgi:hypothetical protein
METKKVNKNSLYRVYENLKEITKNCKDEDTTKNLGKVLKYYEKSILSENKDFMNHVKQLIYSDMMYYRDVDINKNQELYSLYQDFKNNKINFVNALSKHADITRE